MRPPVHAAEHILLYLSHSIFTEYDEVLHRKKFCFDPNGVRRLLRLVRQAATFVEPAATLTVSSHEPDNRLLECAQASRAHCLVTGNTPLPEPLEIYADR